MTISPEHPATRLSGSDALLYVLVLLYGGPVQAGDAGPSAAELARHEKLAAIKHDPRNTLSGFTTDGCSGGLSAGWDFMAGLVPGFSEIHGNRPPWESCCVDHDRVYHQAGPGQASALQSYRARERADRVLEQCVTVTATGREDELARAYGLSAAQVQQLYAFVASTMYRAVRVGGIPCSGLPWRWGYGWPECR